MLGQTEGEQAGGLALTASGWWEAHVGQVLLTRPDSAQPEMEPALLGKASLGGGAGVEGASAD